MHSYLTFADFDHVDPDGNEISSDSEELMSEMERVGIPAEDVPEIFRRLQKCGIHLSHIRKRSIGFSIFRKIGLNFGVIAYFDRIALDYEESQSEVTNEKGDLLSGEIHEEGILSMSDEWRGRIYLAVTSCFEPILRDYISSQFYKFLNDIIIPIWTSEFAQLTTALEDALTLTFVTLSSSSPSPSPSPSPSSSSVDTFPKCHLVDLTSERFRKIVRDSIQRTLSSLHLDGFESSHYLLHFFSSDWMFLNVTKLIQNVCRIFRREFNFDISKAPATIVESFRRICFPRALLWDIEIHDVTPHPLIRNEHNSPHNPRDDLTPSSSQIKESKKPKHYMSYRLIPTLYPLDEAPSDVASSRLYSSLIQKWLRMIDRYSSCPIPFSSSSPKLHPFSWSPSSKGNNPRDLFASRVLKFWEPNHHLTIASLFSLFPQNHPINSVPSPSHHSSLSQLFSSSSSSSSSSSPSSSHLYPSPSPHFPDVTSSLLPPSVNHHSSSPSSYELFEHLKYPKEIEWESLSFSDLCSIIRSAGFLKLRDDASRAIEELSFIYWECGLNRSIRSKVEVLLKQPCLRERINLMEGD
jgi:hypothetical protein